MFSRTWEATLRAGSSVVMRTMVTASCAAKRSMRSEKTARLEIKVERAARDAGLRHDVVDRRLVVAALRELVARRRQDLLPAFRLRDGGGTGGSRTRHTSSDSLIRERSSKKVMNHPDFAVGSGCDAARDAANLRVGHVDVVAVCGAAAGAFGEHHC
jgi:hypothetical protein